MTIYKTIVCLASSRKRSKRCVAGKEIVNNQLTPNWIRPISRQEMGELSETEIVLKNGKGPKLLDIITIPLTEHQSHAYQTENYLIAHHRAWRKQSSLSVALLHHLCDEVESIWINGYHTSHGKNDKIPLDLVTENIESSLLLIKPDALTIKVSTDNYKSHKKVRAYFTYKNQEYIFSVTDLSFELKYETKKNGDYPITNKVYLCLSLSEPFKGDCYKLVAGVILMKEIYTIGHSNHSIEHFVDLLKKHDITAIGDVRSHPYSKYNPQFSYEALKPELKKHNIAYVFLGKELGARSDDPSCYNQEGKVQYARMAQTENFKKGIERLNQGLESYRIAMMCAEKDPLMCHRTILIARQLRAENMLIQHILEDGNLETQTEAEQRLMDLLKQSKQDLFATPEQLIEQAYDMQSDKIAYIEANDEQS